MRKGAQRAVNACALGFFAIGIIASAAMWVANARAPHPEETSTMIGMSVVLVVFAGLLPTLACRYFILGDVKEAPHLLRIGEAYQGKLIRYSRLPNGPMRHVVVEWEERGIASGAHFDIIQPSDKPLDPNVTVYSNLGNPSVAVILNGELYVGPRNSTRYRQWKAKSSS